jgi:Carboxypeptidase regulatory-like domain
MLQSRLGVLVALCAFLWGSVGRAQIQSGTITGTVVDNSSASVPDSQVTVTNEATGAARNQTTTESGAFNFAGLPPGNYTVRVEKSGFRPVIQPGLVLTADQRLALGNVQLTVGQTNEAITVTTEAAAVHTEDAEVSGTLGTAQLNDLMIKGREFMNTVKLLPGVSQNGGADVAGAAYGVTPPNIAGMRSNFINITLDGQMATDAGTAGVFSAGIGADMIAELKVETSSYLAETGPNPGGTIRITTKSGTRDFHGSAYWFKRHQEFNATDFFTNRQGLTHFPYRLTTAGFTVGGPIFIPKVMNTGRNKVFFFYNTEITRSVLPSGVTSNAVGAILQYTTPTALERIGDFSKSVDTNGKLIVVKNPATGVPFPNNMVPQNMINTQGQKLLNVFPLPNVTNPALTGNLYNFQFENYQDVPKQSHTLKTDYIVSNKDTLAVRLHRWSSDTKTYTGAYSYNGTPLTFYDYLFTHNDILLNWTRIITPSIVNEFSASFIGTRENGEPNAARPQTQAFRSTYGITLGQLSPLANPYGILPSMTFTGVSLPVSFSTDARAPIYTNEDHYETSDNLSWNLGSHSLKFGFYMDMVHTNEGQRANCFNGCLSFNQDVNNPLESNDPFANALMGNFDSYQEASRRNIARMVENLPEFYAQDQWKVNRKLTLNYGARFSIAQWYHMTSDNLGSMLVTSAYNRAQTPRQYVSGIVKGVRVAVDPLTGLTQPAVAIGAFVPGTGNPANGVITNAQVQQGVYPQGFENSPGVKVSPRVAFAYDVFGNGTTAIRGGMGVGYNVLYSANFWANQMGFNQPYVVIGQQFYGNLNTLASTSGLVFPSTIGAIDKNSNEPRVYNWSIGIQRSLPWKLTLDATYMGNSDRWLQSQEDLNSFPAGTRFLPQNQDPTTGKPLSDNLLRPYPEYTGITYLTSSNTSYYHALGVQVSRRAAAGLQFQIAYTASRARGTSPDTCNLPSGTTTDTNGYTACNINQFVPSSQWLNGLVNYNQNNVFVANFQYHLPRASSLVHNNAVVKGVFDNWELSGIFTYASGFPFSVTATSSTQTDISGSNIVARPNVVSGCNSNNAAHDFLNWFNTACFAVPAKGTFGNSGPSNYTGPPIDSVDLSVTKDFPFGKNETRKFRLRVEAYNALNHTQFLTINSAARFDGSGNQINSQLGQATAARSPRVLQLAGIIYF